MDSFPRKCNAVISSYRSENARHLPKILIQKFAHKLYMFKISYSITPIHLKVITPRVCFRNCNTNSLSILPLAAPRPKTLVSLSSSLTLLLEFLSVQKLFVVDLPLVENLLSV